MSTTLFSHLRARVLKAQYAVLQALRVETHPDKTFLGKVAKGFDFLGFHCCPTGMRVSDAALSRRDKKLARLYEQGADKKRIALYLALWLGWAGGAWGEGLDMNPVLKWPSETDRQAECLSCLHGAAGSAALVVEGRPWWGRCGPPSPDPSAWPPTNSSCSDARRAVLARACGLYAASVARRDCPVFCGEWLTEGMARFWWGAPRRNIDPAFDGLVERCRRDDINSSEVWDLLRY